MKTHRARLSFASVAAVLMLAACAAPPPSTPAPASIATSDPAACVSAGGALRPVCRMQRLMCVRPYPDAGKTCTDDAQCAGGCLYDGAVVAADGATTGVCRKDNDPCGCVEHVLSGKKANGVCVD